MNMNYVNDMKDIYSLNGSCHVARSLRVVPGSVLETEASRSTVKAGHRWKHEFIVLQDSLTYYNVTRQFLKCKLKED